MATPDRIISLRFVDGVNRIEDARITDAGSWWTTENLYGRNPGVLAKRPGSKIIVNDGGVYLLPGPRPVVPPSGRWGVGRAGAASGEVNLAAPKATFNAKNDLKIQTTVTASAAKGGEGYVDDTPLNGSELPVVSPALNFVVIKPTRISYLQRINFDLDKNFWVGVLDYGQQWADQLFYITPAKTLQIIATGFYNDTNAISGHGSLFQVVPFRSGGSDVATQQVPNPEYSYWAIGTNQVDAPFCLKQGEVGITATTLEVGRSTEFVALPGGTNSSAFQRIFKVQALAVYQGAIVYGGYRMKNLDGGPTSIFDHYITFSDTGEPHKLATTEGLVSSIRIGDTESEPITAMATSTVPTDTMGIKGQLVVFTEKRVAIFDGLPPLSGSPLGTNFQSTVLKGVGCNSPRTVVQTPGGVVFLGSDGRVYLVNGLSGIVSIGTAVEAFFKTLTPRQQRQCHAYWDPAGFYKLCFQPVVPVGVQAWSGKNDPFPDNPIPLATITELQLWADLRTMGGQDTDLGVRWFGPMTGMKHACYGVANDASDKNQIYAGSAIDGSIYETGLQNLTVDPIPEDPTNTRVITVAAITGLFDMGDAHVDKLVTAVAYGVGTDRSTTVECSIIVNGTVAGASSQETFTEAVEPGGDILGTDFVAGASTLSSGDDFTLVTERPATRRRGKTFRFTFAETGGARLFFSDFGFRAIVAQRRK